MPQNMGYDTSEVIADNITEGTPVINGGTNQSVVDFFKQRITEKMPTLERMQMFEQLIAQMPEFAMILKDVAPEMLVAFMHVAQDRQREMAGNTDDQAMQMMHQAKGGPMPAGNADGMGGMTVEPLNMRQRPGGQPNEESRLRQQFIGQ